MSTHSEAVRLNLEYYRKQAKARLATMRSADPGAALHDAQLTIAKEQGFPSWPRFQAFIVQSGLDFQSLVTKFIDAALSDLRRAEEMLGTYPGIGGAGLYSALVLGDWKKVEKALHKFPAMVNAKSGPRAWEPLLYVCFSLFARRTSDRADDLVETARVLLRHGADPNASYICDQWPDNPLPCLYGATGVNNNPALALALLEAGANPNDSESLYHSTEHADLACVKLLLEHGANPAAMNRLKHMLDREDIEGLRLLLRAGADPNQVNQRGETALHWAVWRGRSAQIITELLDSGVAVDARRKDGRTAYAMAVRSGDTEVAALLATRGAKRELSVVDRFMGACATADEEQVNHLLAEKPDIPRLPETERLIPDLASSHRTSSVRALLAAGLPVDARGEMGCTALHWACWKGYADLVKLLIEHGASLTIEDDQYHGTPPGWFGHGLQNCREGDGNYPEVARLLLAAGATIPACDVPTGNAEVDAVLREHGFIVDPQFRSQSSPAR